MRPRWGLRPTSPHQAAGMRTEPAPSDPTAAGTSPAATAAAEPPLEPPGVWFGFHGLRAGTKSGPPSVNAHWPNSGVAVLPTTTAPAERGRLTSEVDVVLDRHRHAEQGHALAGGQAPVGVGGRDQRGLAAHEAERAELRLEPLDPRQRALDELGGGDLAVRQHVGLAAQGGEGELGGVGVDGHGGARANDRLLGYGLLQIRRLSAPLPRLPRRAPHPRPGPRAAPLPAPSPP